MKKLNYFPFGSSQIYDVQTQFETENGRENGNINLQIQFYSEKQQIQTNDFLYAWKFSPCVHVCIRVSKTA